MLRLENDETFLRLFDDFTFELVHALFTFKRLQEDNWSDPSCLEGFLYVFDKGVIDITKLFTVLG